MGAACDGAGPVRDRFQRACVLACVRVFARARVRGSVYECACVFCMCVRTCTRNMIRRSTEVNLKREGVRERKRKRVEQG